MVRKRLNRDSTKRVRPGIATRTAPPDPSGSEAKSKAKGGNLGKEGGNLGKEHCNWCGGNGQEPPLPNIVGVDQKEWAKTSGLSESLISRMLNDDPAQSRPNPTLNTLKKLQRGLAVLTGRRFPLDSIAVLISD